MDLQTEARLVRPVTELPDLTREVRNLYALRAWAECARKLRTLSTEARRLADEIDPAGAGDREEPYT
jgi:hypothetical protein